MGMGVVMDLLVVLIALPFRSSVAAGCISHGV
jgi:hypothetical protein